MSTPKAYNYGKMWDDLSVDELRRLARAKKRLLEHDAKAGLIYISTSRAAVAALWAIRGGLPTAPAQNSGEGDDE